jgi:hypothetical protein
MPDYNSFEKNRSIGMSILHFQVRPYGRGGKMKTISRGGGKAARTLLSCGVASGPVFLLIFVIQILIHPEFHFTHSEPSLLSIGSLGWIQIANCVIGGLLVIAGSLGMRVVLRSSKGGGWGPLLLAIFGGGTVGVGVFVADAAGSATSRTFHGTMHLVFGGVSFGCLMFACFVFARAFTSLGQKPWAIFSAVTGLLFLAGFFSAANASQGARSIQLFLNLIFVLAWVWISLISRRLLGIVSAWETTQSLN